MLTDKNNIKYNHQTAIRSSYSKNGNSMLLTKALASNLPSIKNLKDSLKPSIETFLLRTAKYLKGEYKRNRSNHIGYQYDEKKNTAKIGNYSKQGSQFIKRPQNYFDPQRKNTEIASKNCNFIKLSSPKFRKQVIKAKKLNKFNQI